VRLSVSLLWLFLVACQGPDRWHLSGSRGESDYSGLKGLSIDEDSHSIEVGVSGPLGFREEAKAPPAMPQYQPQPAPVDGDSGLPLMELLLLLGGAGALKGSEYGLAKYRQRRAS
jgi:hypothetical protein